MPRKSPLDRAAAEIAGACHAVRLRAVTRSITSVYDEALRPLGLKGSQLNLLVAIATAGEPRPRELARALAMDKSTVSRNVDKLVASGWVERVGTGRAQTLHLTDAGGELLRAALPLWRKAQAKTAALVGDDGASALRELHTRLVR